MVSPLVWSGLIFLGMTVVVMLVGGVYLRHRRTKAVTKSAAETQSTRRPVPQSPPVASEAGCSLLFAVAWIAFSVLVMGLALGVMSSQWQNDPSGDSTAIFLFAGCFALMAGLFGVIGVWMLVQSWRTIALAWSLTRQGQVTQATVTDRWVGKDSGGNTISCLAYRFSVPDGPDIETAEVNRAAYGRYSLNDTVTVQYLPDQPEICRLVL